MLRQMKLNPDDKRFSEQDMADMGKSLAISVLDYTHPDHASTMLKKVEGKHYAVQTWAIEKVRNMYRRVGASLPEAAMVKLMADRTPKEGAESAVGDHVK
jgi:hypothetical protein